MFSSFRFLARFGHRTASSPVVVMLTDLRSVGFAIVFAAWQGKSCFTDTRTIDPLQRQAYAHYQEVER